MSRISILKRIIILFKSYGISLLGPGKRLHFNDQLQMDKIFVYGLIFELEYLLQVKIEEDWEGMDTPEVLIQSILNKLNQKTLV